MSDRTFDRLRSVRVPIEIRNQLFMDGAVLEAELPDNAQFIRNHTRPEHHAEDYVFWSSEFDAVPEAGDIPVDILQIDVSGVEEDKWAKCLDADPEQRKIIRISDDAFSCLFRGRTRVVDGIPSGASITNQYRCADYQYREFVIKSPTFERVGHGELPELMELEFDTPYTDTTTSLSSYVGRDR